MKIGQLLRLCINNRTKNLNARKRKQMHKKAIIKKSLRSSFRSLRIKC